MPSIYAHYTFGEMMKKAFPADIRKLISLHEDLFEIGLHGPDHIISPSWFNIC